MLTFIKDEPTGQFIVGAFAFIKKKSVLVGASVTAIPCEINQM